MKTNYSSQDITSIVVTYKPELKDLKKILKNHQLNFTNIIIVNNSPEISLDSFKSSQVNIINNPYNIGLAAALNIGIAEAKIHGAKMVALFDQDTLLSNDFLLNMLKHINSYDGSKKPALFSPVFFNKVTNDYGSIINFKPFRLIRNKPNKQNSVTHAQYVITSGSFIITSVFDEIGLMCEQLLLTF